MSIGAWWKRMKDTYGDLPPGEAFSKGKFDGKVLTTEVKLNQKRRKHEKRLERKKQRRNKNKSNVLFRE